MSWTHILGHDRWVKVFGDVVRHHRLAHAYLFLGPDGVGKRMFAQELAKTLLCEERGDAFAACGHCPSCALVDAGTHPDFFTVRKPEGKNELVIGVMRDFCANFALKPARGHGRMAIVEDADDLNEESANCFLKTLEEPPAGALIMLIGTSRDYQMPTILSRCQLIRFAPLPENLMRELLVRQGVPGDLLPRVLRLASGSPGQAIALAEPEIWQFRQQLLTGLVQPVPDTVALAKAWTQFAESAGKDVPTQRQRARQVLRLLQAFLADALALAAGSPSRGEDAQDRNLLLALCTRAGPEKILTLLERTLEAERQLERYIQVSLVLESLLVGGAW